MTTLSAGSTATLTLLTGDSVRVVAPPNAQGTVTVTQSGQAFLTGGGTTLSPITVPFGPVAMDRTFGPYPVGASVVVACTLGSVDYTQTTTAGSALVSNAGKRFAGGTRLWTELQTVGLADRTVYHFWGMPAAWDAVRIVYLNPHTAAYDLNCVIAATESAAGQCYPVVGGANKTTAADLTPVTLSGSTTLTNALGAATAPTLTATDWISSDKVSAIPRTDGVPGFMLLVKHYVPATATTVGKINRASADIVAYQAQAGAFSFRQFYTGSGVNAITTPAAGASPTEGYNNVWPTYFLEFRFRGAVRTVAAIGDSTFSGTTYTIGGLQSFIQLAGQASAGTIFPVNVGWSGLTSAQYWANGQKYLAVSTPTHAVYLTWSVNDGAAAPADLCAARGRTLEFIDYCQRNRINPIVVTPWPKPIGVNNDMAAFRAWVRALGVPVLDADLLLGTGPDNNRSWALPAYCLDAGLTHPSDAAHAIMAAALPALLL